jgi:ABC-2 type transport system ATP-binding protein
MPELAISTRGLRKTYRTRRGRKVVAVQGLDLDVPVGGVHGFLGPNGSGKTTSIRMLLGLIRADAGSMRVFGRPVPAELPAVVGRVLEQTLLGERGKDKFRAYSLGMKQRLAIAATLLKEPDLLIFDEPTNGLDPAGIREIRETMRSLGDQGRTVLVSSHILAEVEQVADTVSIIGHGRLLASGSVAEVIGGGTAGTVKVAVDNHEAAIRILTAAGMTVRADGNYLVVEGAEHPADVTRRLAHQELYVSELVPVRADLESVFLELTAGEGLR